MEKLDLTGTNSQKAHHDIIKSFWIEFGKDGHKHYMSNKSKQYTLDKLKLLGDTIILRNNNSIKTKITRARFEKVKQKRHSLNSHKNCFACLKPADIRHHIIWIKHGGINSKRNLISLCHECHCYLHPWLKKP